jgi:hypothetical protein
LERQQLADTVAKVENQAAPKISQKLIFNWRRHCKTPLSPFWSSPQKDSFNTIGTYRACAGEACVEAQGRPYRPGRSPHWIKVKNQKHPAFNRVLDQFG